jgi:hypothetical protein
MASDLSVPVGAQYEAIFRGALAVDEPNQGRLVSPAMNLQDAMRQRRTCVGLINYIIDVRDERDRGSEDTGVPPCPRASLHGGAQE